MKNSKAAVAIVGFVLTVAAVPQVKHAPTLESCTADINLWTSQLPGFPDTHADQLHNGTKTLTASEMEARIESIGDCADAHPIFKLGQPGQMSPAYALTAYYALETEHRYHTFLLRHDLAQKFHEEDEAGLR